MCVDRRGIHSVASQSVSEVHLGTNSILVFVCLFVLLKDAMETEAS